MFLVIECYVVHTDPNGLIMSPGFPNHDLEQRASGCSWLIQIPQGKLIKIEFLIFDIKSEQDCE